NCFDYDTLVGTNNGWKAVTYRCRFLLLHSVVDGSPFLIRCGMESHTESRLTKIIRQLYQHHNRAVHNREHSIHNAYPLTDRPDSKIRCTDTSLHKLSHRSALEY